MEKNNMLLEKRLKEFLNSSSNRVMRGLSKLTVFSGTCYAGWWGIASYIDYYNKIGSAPIMILGTLATSYGASRWYGHIYNKVAEGDFKEKWDKINSQ